MPIRDYLPDQDVFDDVALKEISRAFEEACAALRVTEADVAMRERIALRILQLARDGVRDAQILRDQVVHSIRLG